MHINELLDVSYDFFIEGITDDSREVKDNYIFVATKGFYVDHFDYIEEAIQKGCVFLVVDREIARDFPHIVVDHIDDFYQKLCIKFYQIQLDKFHLIGITGTDGKTTTTTVIKELIKDCATIGTNGVLIGEDSIDTHNTTPCISELYQDLKIIQDRHISNISMEVSSEALLHNRVSNLKFDYVAITNVTGDHLNIHGSFENYLQSKLKILDMVKDDGYIFLNGDDFSLKNIKRKHCYTYGFLKDNDFIIEKVKYLKRKTIITLNLFDKKIKIDSPYIGKYNVYNIVLGYLIGHFFGIEDCLLLKRIRELRPIKGRCEFLDFKQNYSIVLDYAHTINGISNILDTFRNYSHIIVVTGCAGGRDKSKRRTIGELIIKNCDMAIFTMDDPRFEDVDTIIDDMVGDFSNYIRIIDRKSAIHYAFDHARDDSVVLILGKGRDNYMAIEDKKISYSDYDVIQEYFENINR